MRIVEPAGVVPHGWRRAVVAENQPEYRPMPALIGYHYVEKPHLSCWKLTWRERLKVLLRGELWVCHLTFDGPIRSEPQSPLMLDVERPEWTKGDVVRGTRMYQ
jgi:hypothetical protein